ncbi:outer dense fiber protein 2 isoform X2 [Genypterus blacodes]|uniref:outer dense fiber protein 2 isoform X2 n=1 Tax=Genypterus blacodes TaxID=154954 RepID=UPI003F76B478
MGKTKCDRGNLPPTAKVITQVPRTSPGKLSKPDGKYKWEGRTHCLEITPMISETSPGCSSCALQMTDLTHEEEEDLQGQISQCEEKVDVLLTEVSSLKNEVELRKKEQLLAHQSEQLNTSQCVIADQEVELAEVTKELEETEHENAKLRQSMEKILWENDCNRKERDFQHQDKRTLLRKLREAEMEAKAAAQQVSALCESVSKMEGTCGRKKQSGPESSALAHQKEQLLQKLEAFETINRSLRHRLREQHGCQVASKQFAEEKDTLLRRLTDTMAENAHLAVKLQDKERDVNQLSKCIDSEKENAKNTADLSKIVESTRAHLQGQLCSKEAQNNRLAVQIKSLEFAANQQESEIEHLSEQLTKLKLPASADRAALKGATKAQKQRAECSEDTADQLSTHLLNTERKLADALSVANTWQSQHAKEAKEKSRLEIELSALNSHVSELTQQLQSTEYKGEVGREALQEHLRGITTESSAAKAENQTLKAAVSRVEDRLLLSESELQQVKATIRQYESLMDGYKVQVVQTQAEAGEYCARLGQAEREAQAVREELDREIQGVRGELLGQLAELEPLPEALRCCKIQLQTTQERERSQERRSRELSTMLTDLRMKVETRRSQMDVLGQKNKVLLGDNTLLQEQVESLESSILG